MRHTPIVLAEAIVQLLDEAQASSSTALAALEIAKHVIKLDEGFDRRDDDQFEAKHAARDAARESATASSGLPSQQP